MRTNQYKTVIIGCGKMAGGYDDPGNNQLLTHAHAIVQHPKTVLAGVYDIDYGVTTKFAAKWETTAYSSIEELFNNCKPQIVVIAAATSSHFDIIDKCIQYKPQIIICEKPFGNGVERAKSIIRELDKLNISIVINFSRRYDSSVIELQKDIECHKYGSLINGSAIYAKGIQHNGSHLINLLLFLFGSIESFEVLHSKHDYFKDDPTIDIFIRFKNGNVFHLIGADENKYTIFDVDLLFATRRITFINCGFEKRIQVVRKDPVYPDYYDLTEGIIEETELKYSLTKMYDNVTNVLEGKEQALCTAQDAVDVQMFCHKVLENLKPILS